MYEYAYKVDAKTVTGRPPIRLKWIDTNKGDKGRPNYRSRLVCTEVRRKGTVPIFSANAPSGGHLGLGGSTK